MTTVLRRGRLKIAVYRESSGKHHSPHCHAYLLDAEAIFDLLSFKCLANSGFNKKALLQIKEIVREHKEDFLNMWSLLNEED